MTQKTLERLNRNISELQKEIGTLRSFVIGVLGRDKEGTYRPDFVRKVLKTASEKGSFAFRNREAFLKKVRS